MIWNTIPNDEKLRLWKQLRADIATHDLHTQLLDIAKFCANIPYGTRTIDYYDTSAWPTPWEILFHGIFCTSSISLLMYYTLIMVSPDLNIELYLVDDVDGTYLVPVIDNQFILNYELGTVNNYADVSNKFSLLLIYTKDQIKSIT